jgi:hypothetical protein
MDDPLASTHSGRAAAAARSAAAIAEGCIVDIAGVPVGVGASDLPRAEALATAFGRLPPHSGPAAAQISFGEGMPAVPTGAPDESYGAFHVWRRGLELFLAHGDHVAGVVTPDAATFGGAPSAAFRNLVQLALGHVLGFAERFVLHAGVIERGARVALVLGDSGAGKSTVTISAHVGAWRALGDDIALVAVDATGVRVMTLGLPLAFPGELFASPLPGSEPMAGDPRGRWTLASPPPDGGREVTDLVVATHSTAAEGSLERIRAMDSFEQVIGAFVAMNEPLLLRRFFPVASVLSRARAWRLGLPSEGARRVAGVATLIDSSEIAQKVHQTGQNA